MSGPNSTIQLKLNAIYERIGKLDQIYAILGDNSTTREMLDEIDGPFLIHVDSQYLQAHPKVLFIGQENNGWVGLTGEYLSSNSIQDAILHYEDFDFENTYASNFFYCLKNIREHIFGEDQTTKARRSIIWSNLFKFNQWNQPQMNWSEYKEPVLNLQGDLFREETCILDPDATVFATGPYYDEVIKHFYPDVEFQQVEDYSIRSIAQIKSLDLPELSFRTYHPEYAMGKGKSRVPVDFYQLIADIIKNEAISI